MTEIYPRHDPEPQQRTLTQAVWLGVKCFSLIFGVFCVSAMVLNVVANAAQLASNLSNTELWRGTCGSLLLSIPVVGLVGV